MISRHAKPLAIWRYLPILNSLLLTLILVLRANDVGPFAHVPSSVLLLYVVASSAFMLVGLYVNSIVPLMRDIDRRGKWRLLLADVAIVGAAALAVSAGYGLADHGLRAGPIHAPGAYFRTTAK